MRAPVRLGCRFDDLMAGSKVRSAPLAPRFRFHRSGTPGGAALTSRQAGDHPEDPPFRLQERAAVVEIYAT
jgi:hypothetical protein